MKSSTIQRDIWDRTWKEMLEIGTFPETEFYDIQWHKFLIDEISERVNFSEYKRMLECGCGNGIFGLEFANQFPFLQLYLSDLSPAALKYSKALLKQCIKKRPEENFKRLSIKYKIEDMFNLSYKDNFFNFVVNGGSLEHYSDKKINLLLNEMLRVLKPTGVLVIVVPNIRNFDLTIKRIKLFIRDNAYGLLLKDMLDYGGNDERNITFAKFKTLTEKNKNIKSIQYVKHPIAYPGFIPRTMVNSKIAILFERLLIQLGFNWANIFIIKKP